MPIQEELQKWAEETVAVYNSLGREYYQQSPLTAIVSHPDILICGINPGSAEVKEVEPHDADYILKGNRCWDGHTKWGFWRNLKTYFVNCPEVLSDESRFVLTNYSFCSTPKANEISDELLSASAPCTLALIRILKPKFILLLSGKAAFRRLERQGSLDAPYTMIDNNMQVGRICDIPVLGVPHPSAHLSRETRAKIAQTVSKFLLEKQ